jgi:predicted Rossmann fold flavoprotein
MYDLIIVGGGPAGLMAGNRASEKGASVLILEKNKKPGVKLLITGKGRCNITNNELDVRNFVNNFGPKGSFLFSSLSRFGVFEIMDFFEKRGLKLKIERGLRVFPKSDRASDVCDLLTTENEKNKSEIRTGVNVTKIVLGNDKKEIEKIISSEGEEFFAKNFLITTGGKSYPATGSDGSLYDEIKKMGHKMIKAKPSLVPVICSDEFVGELEGLSLKNVDISIWQNNKKIDERFGEALFTDRGMSGPIILDMSQAVGLALEKKEKVELQIDFKPALSFQELDLRIQKDFKENQNRNFKNSIDGLYPKKIIPLMIRLSGINPDKKVNEITKEERKGLVKLTKEFVLNVKKLDDFKKAIITSGGVDLSELDAKTCRSKIIGNLFFAGEILDLDGPTGGFNLQICWSTGYAVGDSF